MNRLRKFFFIIFVALIMSGLVFPFSETSVAEENNAAPCVKSCDDNMRICRNRHSDRKRCNAQFQKCLKSCNQNKKDSVSPEEPKIPDNNEPKLH